MLILFIITGCQNETKKESSILLNEDSEEITFILEMSINENYKEDVEEFTQYLSDFIVEREPSTVYGYFISEDRKKVTLIEKYNNSQDGIQHGKDFISGPNFDKFFEVFKIESFITLGRASNEFKTFTKENGFDIQYRESIGGYVRK